jgi:acetyltransferase EpsM
MIYREHFIFGAGGHGRVIAELLQLNNYNIEAFFDDNPKTNIVNSLPVISSKNILNNDLKLYLIIAIGDNFTRKNTSKRLKNNNYFSCTHKNAIVSITAKIDIGTVVMANAVINSNANIGKHVIINTSAIVEHDCTIEDFVHISPNTTLLGNVFIGEGTQVCAGVVILPGVKVGKWCVIGAGSIILKDVPDGSIVVGNPGRIIKQNPIYESAMEFESMIQIFS